MKRKVIQHSPTSMVVTLPSNWLKENKIGKGDELNLELNENQIIITKEKGHRERRECTVDISKLDRTTILYIIRNLYRAGYDKVMLKFMNQTVPYKEKNHTALVSQIIHREVSRLIGYEITREKTNYCIVENISEGLREEIPAIIKRIYLMIIDLAEVMHDAVENHDKKIMKTVEQKYGTIVRFINYCIRSANTEVESHISNAEYHTLATLDRIVHIFRSASSRIGNLEKKAPDELIKVSYATVEALRKFNAFQTRGRTHLVVDMNSLRYMVEEAINARKAPLNLELDLVYFHYRHIHHLLLDIINVKGLDI